MSAIWIVDDCKAARRLVASLLSRLGLAPVCFESGEDALNAYLAEPDPEPKVILFDQNMPGWTGTETARRLRTLGCNAEVCMMSGCLADISSADLEPIGVALMLAKPISIDAMSIIAEIANAA